MSADSFDSAEPQETPTKRGKGFPILPLAEAREIVAEAGQYGTSHSTTAFAQYMGLNSTVGGAFKNKMAALRDWALIARRTGTQVEYTELGKRLAFPMDEAALAEDMRRAFNGCAIFSDAYQALAKGRPLNPQNIGNMAVNTLGVSPKSRQQFVKSLVASAEAAGLAEPQADGNVVFRPDTAAAVAEDDRAQPTAVTGSPAAAAPATQRAAPAPSAAAFEQTWPVDGGSLQVRLALDRPLPPAAYGKLGQMSELALQLTALLSEGAPKSATEEEADE
jgi:hypothetical protein